MGAIREKQLISETLTKPEDGLEGLSLDSFEILLKKARDYWTFDEELAKETISKYETCLKRILVDLPHISSPLDLRLEDITELKKVMKERGVGPAGINSAVFSLRKFLTYCRDIQKLDVIDPKEILRAKESKREVDYLTPDELKRFAKAINVRAVTGLRMRTLFQVLISTGMRISEALSLNRDDIDWDRKQAVIIGKGSKQRTVYFTDEALRWIRFYLTKRRDDNPALFITTGKTRRLRRYDISKQFKLITRKAGIQKKVSPHILRHSYATILINNGCDIFHVKNLLGHADIKTTSRYYLGVDKKATKAAHEKYLRL